jgi:hypothetical protein
MGVGFSCQGFQVMLLGFAALSINLRSSQPAGWPTDPAFSRNPTPAAFGRWSIRRHRPAASCGREAAKQKELLLIHASAEMR